jgi:hypothetical protein
MVWTGSLRGQDAKIKKNIGGIPRAERALLTEYSSFLKKVRLR